MACNLFTMYVRSQGYFEPWHPFEVLVECGYSINTQCLHDNAMIVLFGSNLNFNSVS